MGEVLTGPISQSFYLKPFFWKLCKFILDIILRLHSSAVWVVLSCFILCKVGGLPHKQKFLELDDFCKSSWQAIKHGTILWNLVKNYLRPAKANIITNDSFLFVSRKTWGWNQIGQAFEIGQVFNKIWIKISRSTPNWLYFLYLFVIYKSHNRAIC